MYETEVTYEDPGETPNEDNLSSKVVRLLEERAHLMKRVHDIELELGKARTVIDEGIGTSVNGTRRGE